MEEGQDTFPRLLAAPRAQLRPERIRRRARKTSASGRPGRGRRLRAEVRALACGLAAQGFKRGMHLAIIGDNRPRLYWSMVAAQALGGVPVPMYQDAPAAEFVYVLNDAEIGYALVEDQEQVDKMLEAQPQVPTLAAHLLRRPARPAQLRERDELRAAAGNRPRIRPRASRILRRGGGQGTRPTTFPVMLYTSGTTGQAEGRVPDARRVHRRAARALLRSTSSSPDDSILSYLPMAWVGDHLFSYAQWLVRRVHDQLPRIGRDGDDRPARDRADATTSRRRASSRTC